MYQVLQSEMLIYHIFGIYFRAKYRFLKIQLFKVTYIYHIIYIFYLKNAIK